MKEALGADVELVPGSGGAFEVTVDGQLRYSKLKTGSFPDNSTLIGTLRARG